MRYNTLNFRPNMEDVPRGESGVTVIEKIIVTKHDLLN